MKQIFVLRTICLRKSASEATRKGNYILGLGVTVAVTTIMTVMARKTALTIMKSVTKLKSLDLSSSGDQLENTKYLE